MSKLVVDYARTINNIYNSNGNLKGLQHKFKTIANAVEEFIDFLSRNSITPTELETRFKNFSESYDFGREVFGLYFASIFCMFLDNFVYRWETNK